METEPTTKMNPLNLDEVNQYVNDHIDEFHQNRLAILSGLRLKRLLKKNPYLFRAKNITKASALVEGTMSAFLSSSEEECFGNFLEGLAIFVAKMTTGGMKSGSPGIDLEFEMNKIHYLVSVKSGPNWGNSSQWKELGRNFGDAFTRMKQARQPFDGVIGMCYGKIRSSRNKQYGYLKLYGQNFWTFISGNKELYREIIEPLGYKAKEHNDNYGKEKDKITNVLTLQFISEFCDSEGTIDWKKVVQANSGIYDLDKHGFTYTD
jgi:hypothetical protein